MKQAENFRVRELVKKIESHPHRRALHADLQHNNTHNPFSEELKVMIRDMDSVRAMRNKSKSAMLRMPFFIAIKELYFCTVCFLKQLCCVRHGKTEA